MTTDKQIEANRRNAQLCTGPKTEEGKTRSSQNALKSGIYSKAEVLVTESPEALDELISDFHERFAPATPEEQSLVDALIRYEWLSRRYMAADTAVWNRWFIREDEKDPGVAFINRSDILSRAGRYFNMARKGFSATLKELIALQEKRKSEPEPESNQPQPVKLVSFHQAPIGAQPEAHPNRPATQNPPEKRPDASPGPPELLDAA